MKKFIFNFYFILLIVNLIRGKVIVNVCLEKFRVIRNCFLNIIVLFVFKYRKNRFLGGTMLELNIRIGYFGGFICGLGLLVY